MPRKRLSPDAVHALQALPWRGNVRELRNAIERLAILGEGPVIEAHEVHALAGLAALAMPTAPAPSMGGPAGASPSLEDVRAAGGLIAARRDFERRAIELALDATGGNVSQTAQMLGIERSNLHKKLQSLGLEARPARPARNAPEEDSE